MKEFDVFQLAMAATNTICIHNPDLQSKMKSGIIKAIFPLDLALFIHYALFLLSPRPRFFSHPYRRVATGLHSFFELPPDATVIWSVAS
jgi:hypothetical protein